MKSLCKPIAGVFVLTLAACSANDKVIGGDVSVISSGLLELELPNEADREALPELYQAALVDLKLINEDDPSTVNTSPRGEYIGIFGAELDSDGTLIVGDVTMEVRFAGNNVNYTFEPTEVKTGGENPPITGEFGGSANIVDGYYSGSIIGTVTFSEETLTVSGDLNGVFAESTGNKTIGEFDGTVENLGGPFDGDTGRGQAGFEVLEFDRERLRAESKVEIFTVLTGREFDLETDGRGLNIEVLGDVGHGHFDDVLAGREVREEERTVRLRQVAVDQYRAVRAGHQE